MALSVDTSNQRRASGVYAIRCAPTGKVYVGSAVNYDSGRVSYRALAREYGCGTSTLIGVITRRGLAYA